MGFFDGLSKKGAELSSSLQESVNKTQRESKCKKTMSENKNRIEKIYSEIGIKVCEKREFNEELITFINEKVEEVDRLNKENEELKREILILNNKKICPKCGKEVELSTTFCPSCGAEQEKIKVEAFIPKGKRKCSGCGEIIDDKNEFCPKCGAKKEVVEETPKAEENVKVEEKPKAEEAKTEVKKEVAPAKKVCPGCGEEMAADDVFCANCGYKLDGETKEVEVDSEASAKTEE